MTLLRQFILILVFLFILVFIGIFFIEANYIQSINANLSAHIPAWFVKTIHLITSSPSPSIYQPLWYMVTYSFIWLLTCIMLSFIIGRFLLHNLQRGLKLIEAQINAIRVQEFPIYEKIPNVKELHQLTQAMNKMATSIKSQFETHSKLTEKLREQAYLDPITGLGNRRYFDIQLQYLLESDPNFLNGALFLIELENFKQYNEQQGYQAGDALLQQTANFLTDLRNSIYECLLFRITGSTFAMIVTGLSSQETIEIAQQMSETLLLLGTEDVSEQKIISHIGIIYFAKKQAINAAELLAKADMALRTAQAQTGNNWYLYEEETLESLTHNLTYWRELLQDVIARQNIVLYFQPVVSGTLGNNLLLHYEIFLRIPDQNGKLLTARTFLPMVENSELIAELDKLVITKTLQYLAVTPTMLDRYALNLSPNSIHNPDFTTWLIRTLQQSGDIAKHLIFEITETGAINNLSLIQNLINQLIPLGCQITLDQFGRSFAAFGYLRNLNITYIKVDGSYIHNIDQNKDNQFFIHSLIHIAHGLGILVIAENVETEQEQETLLHLNVDGMQGYLLGQPIAQPKLVR